MLLGLALALCAHPNSQSAGELTLAPDGSLRIELTFEARTVQEFHALDTDGDGALDADELDAQRAFFQGYFAQHYRVGLGTDAERTAAYTLVLDELAFDLLDGQPAATDASHPLNDVWLRASFDAAPPPDAAPTDRWLWLEVDAFLVTSPDHMHFAGLKRGPELGALDWTFTAANPRWVAPLGPGAAPPEAAPFARSIRLGVDHILDGWDHLLFLLALVLASRSPRALAATITAFTLAHSITLACAALGYLPAGGRFVEAVIAASIAFVGLLNLIKATPRSTWLEAAGFGLIHGLGFAGFLTSTLARAGRDEPPLATLLGFNLGVELGQLFVGACFLAILALLERLLPRVQPRRFVQVGSLAVVAMGLYWTFERAFA